AWFERLDAEIDNVRGALAWACRRGAGESALRLAGALTLYWHVRGCYPEGRRWAEAALAAGPDAPPLLRAKALWGIGFMAFYLGDVAATVPAIEECLALARQEGATQEVARALSMMGELASLQDPATAHRLLAESATLAREVDDSWCLSYSLASRAWTEFYKGVPPVGRPFIVEAMEVARTANDTRNLLRGSLCLAWAGLLEGDYSDGGDAERSIELGLTLARRLGDIGWTGLLLNGQGELAWRRGEYDSAGRLLDESAEIGRRLGSPYATAPPYGLLGRRAKAMGNLEEAAAWFEAALEISREAGMHLFVPWWVWGRADVYRLAGDFPSALTWLAEARSVAERVGNEPVVAFTIWARGAIARREGRLEQAEGLHRDALQRRHVVGDGAGILDSLESLAGLAALRGQAARAAQLLAAAGAHRTVNRCARSVPDQVGYDADLAVVRSALPDGAFERAWSEGLLLSRHQAVALALGDVHPDPVDEQI
ncbi:MAG TPA: tetratricopeptide repeat protein, partial [Acidimicrobiales bacterium]|nr:tetratricopeptide repeat protein [Acidimicrobiales bacterium]